MFQITDHSFFVCGYYRVTLIFSLLIMGKEMQNMRLLVITSVLKRDGRMCAWWELVAKIRGVAGCLSQIANVGL